jgi:hypothetical protein
MDARRREDMRRPVLRMTWRDVMFAHWPVDPTVVETRMPDQLSVATHDGDAWLSVVGFEMADVRPRWSPVGRSFPELNLRTYVDDGDTAGVYFFNLDAADALGVSVAQTLYALPYYRAEMRLRREGDAVEFVSRRVQGDDPPARFDATCRPTGDATTPDPDSLTAFLVENYRAYAAGRDGDAVYYVDIDHEPWPIQPAALSVSSNTLFAANGFDEPDGEPLVQYAESLAVEAGRPRRLATSAGRDVDPDGRDPPVPRDEGVDVPVTDGATRGGDQ